MAQSSVDADPLPGEAKSWAPGEPVPKDMPNADSGPGTGGAATAADKATKELADLQRAKINTADRLSGEMIRGMDADLARLHSAYDAEGAALHDPALKPWNEQAEQQKHQTDPIMAFGSLGSVFGILASAFTHAPMQNALNASAAAINAIKQNDRQGYEDARKAWEGNYKLALERQKIQHEQYVDAATLLKTNLGAGEARLKVLAARFDDRKVLTMLDNGMAPEVLQLLDARETLTSKMLANQEKTIAANAEMSFILQHKEKYMKEGLDARGASVKAFQDWQEDQARIKRESSPYASRITSATTQAQFIERRMQEIRDLEHREPNTDDVLKAQRDWTQASTKGSAVVTSAREQAKDVKAIVEEEQKRRAAEGNPMSAKEVAGMRADEERKLKLRAAAPSGNRLDDLKGKEYQVDQALDLTNKIEGLLAKHNAITGLGGRVTRPAEIVGNVFGGNETDRKQFERWVHELQMITPQILLGRSGRPLAAEYDSVNSVVAGLKLGDTSANTVRAYRELDTVLKSIKDRLRDRQSAAPAASEAPKAVNEWWKNDPVVR